MGRNSNKKSSRRKDGGKNIIYIAIGVIAVALVLVFLLKPGPGPHYINDEIGEVRQVIDGNTIQLKNGLKVQLLGVEPSAKSQEFLNKNLVNQQVRLVADATNQHPYYKNAETETVSAYVNMVMPSSFANVNGYMIREKQANLLKAYCNDSLRVYESYIDNPKTDPNPSTDDNYELLSEIDLGKKMTSATFLIMGELPDGSTSIGSGFFIYKNGLALTNYHVLANNAKYTIYVSDENGNITIDRDRPVARLIIANSRLDYAIFFVGLDNGEEVPYLDLARERPERGTRVGVVGNPVASSRLYTATYTTGQISALRESEGEIQFDASVTNGNSGGPVCDYYGRVVGIAKRVAVKNGMQNVANLNFGVDIQEVRKELDELKDVKTYGGK